MAIKTNPSGIQYDSETGNVVSTPVVNSIPSGAEGGISRVRNPVTGEIVEYVYKDYTTPITSASLAPTPSPTILPQPTDTTNYDSIVAGGQGEIGAGTTPAPTPAPAPVPAPLGPPPAGEPPPSTEAAYQQAYKDAGVEEAQKASLAQEARVKSSQAKLAGIQAQIQAVVSKRDVQNLRLEGQASGGQVVTTVLNRQQQEINRQAAIEALPLQALALAAQAEVAGLQGDAEFAQSTLKMAQDKLNTAFELKSKDADRLYNFKKDARDANYKFLTDEQQRRADAKQKEDDKKFQLEKDNLNNSQILSIKFMENGQADLAMQATKLDPKSATFAADLAALQAKFVPKEAAAGRKGEGIETKLLPEDKRNLIGSGLNDVMISNIEEGVRTIGIDEVLEDDYTDAQKAAIRKVYGAESKEITQPQLLQAAQAMKATDVENFFNARYTEDEINKFAKEAGFAGFFKKRATERANYFASPKAREKLAELLGEQYKQQGFTIK